MGWIGVLFICWRAVCVDLAGVLCGSLAMVRVCGRETCARSNEWEVALCWCCCVLPQVLNQMLVLPNAMTFPIMANFGLPKPPKGALNVKLLSAEGVKGKEVRMC